MKFIFLDVEFELNAQELRFVEGMTGLRGKLAVEELSFAMIENFINVDQQSVRTYIYKLMQRNAKKDRA